MYDNSKHDLQGSGQYYYLMSCDIVNKNSIPYSILGKHAPYSGRISGLDYITLELYDNNNNKYLVFLSASIGYYVLQTDGVSTLYDDNLNNGIALIPLTYDQSINIGERFVILVNKSGKKIDVTLTIDGKCELKFMMECQHY